MDFAILFGGLIILLILGFSVTFSMGLSALFYLLVTDQADSIVMLPQQMVVGLEHYGLMAIPLFFLAGAIMTTGGMTTSLLNFSRVIIGRIPGSLSLVNIMASMFFAGVSGSCVADTSAIGSVLIPAMKKDGYSGEYAAAITGASSTIGHIIPPSGAMILIGVLQDLPIGKLFLAGAIPGLLLGFALMTYSLFISIKRQYPREEKAPKFSEFREATLSSLPALFMPVIIIGGILFGVVTVTETAVLACFYAFIVTFAKREMTFSSAWTILKNTAKGSGNLLFLLASASFFSYVVMTNGMGEILVEIVLSKGTNPFLVLTLMAILLLIVGCALDTLAMMFIFVPLLLPIAEAVGISPLHFSTVFVLCQGVALLTPPVGVILFLVADYADVPLSRVISETTPLLLVQLITIAAAIYIPFLSTWLPGLV